jgi:hypothetical protein
LCQTCDEYERLVAIVNTTLDVKSWETSPVDVFDSPAPPMWTDREQADWDRARDQHVTLAKVANMEPVRKGLLTDGCRGQANIRWIERYGKVPDALASVNRSAWWSSSEILSVGSTQIPPTGQRSMPC